MMERVFNVVYNYIRQIVTSQVLANMLKEQIQAIDELKAQTSKQKDIIDYQEKKLPEQQQDIGSNKKMIEKNEESHKTDMSKLKKKAEVKALVHRVGYENPFSVNIFDFIKSMFF